MVLVVVGLLIIVHGTTHVIDGYFGDGVGINTDLVLLGLAWVGVGLFPVGISVQILLRIYFK